MERHETTAAQRDSTRRTDVARRMVLVLPGFGRWATTIREFETPYGSAGIRQLEVLYMLRHNLLDSSKPVATALFERLQIQRSVVTRILAKLESAGYITRQTDPQDGRAQQISITEIGKNLSACVEAEFLREMEAALEDVSDSDLECLELSISVLTRTLGNLTSKDLEIRLGALQNEHAQ